MEMNKQSIQVQDETQNQWEAIGVILPEFDMEKVDANTCERPRWIHFGAGNIFRGFIAKMNQSMLNAGAADTGIVACDTFDYDIIDKIYRPYDDLTLLVSLNADGSTKKEIIAGVSKSLKADTSSVENKEDYKQLVRMFENESLQMVSFTITEKGYALRNADGAFLPVVLADIENGPEAPKHAMSIVASLMLKRFQKGAYKLALCSMDNCSHNGEKLRTAILEIVKEWQARGYVSEEFSAYIRDESMVGFPWSMIDKITPRPAEVVEEALTSAGIDDMKPIITSKNTFIAPFVNAEVCEYLVIEDMFPNGRPELEVGGVFVTDRETVNKTETMKVTTCLNPLHTALAVYGCLLGYTKISDEMCNENLRKLVERIGYVEGMPVVVDPLILSPKVFIDEVINERFPNPFIPDTPQRIATDTSQKVGIRFGETIKSYIKNSELDVRNLTFIPLALAGWLRYLLAVDDAGNEMELSSDPLLSDLQAQLETVSVAGEEAYSYNEELQAILTNEVIFGVDLVACGLSTKIEEMFIKMLQGPGAVDKTLSEYLQ